MSDIFNHRKLTQQALLDEARARFGDDVQTWAFICPSCQDVACANDFRAALKEHPRTHKDGSPVEIHELLGKECIGRTLGALRKDAGPYTGRGCNWTAYGLFQGPWEVVMPDGNSMWGFPLAPATVGAS